MVSDAKPGRVILTYGRSIIALAIAHSLGKRGVEIIGCDDVELTVLQFSKFVQDNFVHKPCEENEAAFIDDLIKYIDRYRPEDDRPYVLIPSFREATVIARYRERLAPHITVAAAPIEAIDAVLTKDAFAKTAMAHNLPIPKTLVGESIDDLRNIDDFPEPAVVKPPDSHGGRGIRICDSKDEALAYAEQVLQDSGELPVIQEAVDGRDYCFAALCDHGELVASMAYQNLQQFPVDSGSGVTRKTVDAEPFRPAAEKLLREIEWNGVAQVDFRWDGEGEPILIEVNPRFWAGLVHSMESGVDFPWLLYCTALGLSTDADEAEEGFTTNTPGLSWLAALQESMDSNESFDELSHHWRSFKNQLEGRSWESAWRSFSKLMTTEIDAEQTVDKLKELRRLSREAHSDLLLEEDPQAALGMLFVISSLFRHGELPPELKT